MESNIVSTEEFNTNNAWGFGGAVGTQTNYVSGVYKRTGKAYYRHLPPAAFTTFYNSKGQRLMDNNRACVTPVGGVIPIAKVMEVISYIVDHDPSKEEFINFLTSHKII